MNAKKLTHLIEVKRTLAAKYTHQSLIAGSKTKQERFMRKANRYTRQAFQLERQLP